jgi:hypothetical protein
MQNLSIPCRWGNKNLQSFAQNSQYLRKSLVLKGHGSRSLRKHPSDDSSGSWEIDYIWRATAQKKFILAGQMLRIS